MEPDKPEQPPDEDFVRAINAYRTGMAQGNVEQVESAALEALTLACEWAEKNPSPELTLINQAAACEDRGDWSGAESRYRQLLEMAQTSNDFSQLTNANLKLCRLFSLLGRNELVWKCAVAATDSACRSCMTPLHIMALEAQALCALRRGDLAPAFQAATAAVGLIEPGPDQDHLRAGAWVTRALCLAELGDEAGAAQDLAASSPILVDCEQSPLLAGVQAKVALYWEAAAALSKLRGDPEGAVEHWSKAVERRRHITTLCHVAGPHTLWSLARTLTGLGEALQTVRRPIDAKAAFDEAKRIRAELNIPA
jgi:tetratricopeptide (TPR) repeat protein